jgi:hypothetical protein
VSRPAVTVSCVVEDRDKWFDGAFTLATSLRNLGGRTASAPMEVLFLGSMDGVFTVPLAAMGVTSRIVERWPGSSRPADRVRALEVPDLEPGAVLIALDHDVAVLRDLSDAVSSASVRAVPAWESPLRPERWRQLLAGVGLAPTAGQWLTPGAKEEVPVPCVESGVLFIPAPMVQPLQSAWGGYIERLDTGGYDLSADELVHLVEIALSLALLETAVPLDFLGPEWNFRGHGLAPATTPVRILHPDATGPVTEGPGAGGRVNGGPGAGASAEPAFQDGLSRDIERLNMIVAARRSQAPREGPGALVAGAAQLAAQAVREMGRPSSRGPGS